jgi:hypothetical protein
MSRAACFAISIIGLGLLVGCASTPSTTSAVDGLYVIPEEPRGYQDERLELRNGRFRYWLIGDSVIVDERGRPLGPKYPLRGTFKVNDHRITFSTEHVDPRYPENVDTKYLDTVNGHSVLWTLSSKRIWERQHKIYDYGVLIRVADRGSDAESPSVRVLYDATMRKRIKEWRDPYVHGPQ